MADDEGRALSKKEQQRLKKLQAAVFGDSSDEDDGDAGDEDGEDDEQADGEEDASGDEDGEEAPAAGKAGAAKTGPLTMHDKLQLIARGKKADAPSGAARVKRQDRSNAEVGKGVARKRGRLSTGAAAGAESEDTPAREARPPAADGGDDEDAPDSEDDDEGVPTAADDAFLDDEEAVPQESDEDDAVDDEDVGQAPQAVEARGKGAVDDDIEELFKPSSRRKVKDDAQRQEQLTIAVDLVARMQTAVDEDAAARERGQVALAKLRLLPEVEQLMRHVDLAPLALDHGLLQALTAWLRPCSDGSLPNARLRVSLLTLCSRLPIDTRDSLGRELLKRSGLGKVAMFYKLHDDTPAGRAAAASLVDGWSRPIFELSAAYRDIDTSQQQVAPHRAADTRRTGIASQRLAQGDEALGDAGPILGPKDPGFRHHAAIPEPAALDYTVRPKSMVSGVSKGKSEPKTVGGKIMKELSKKGKHGPRKASYAAHKVSIEGRNMVIKSDL